jgi:D-galactarolactone cycloisomerase
LRVESVSSFPMRVKMKETLRGSTFGYDDYQSVLVKVSFCGEVGWGEAMTRFSPRATASMVDWIGRELRGREFESPRQAWLSVWRIFRARGQSRGVSVEALSGVEMAMMDSLGKSRKRPVGELLGKRVNGELPCLGGSVFESRGSIEYQVDRVKSLGLRGLKLKIGFGATRDLELARRVRRSWEDCMLVVDANGSYDSFGAAKLAKKLELVRPEWFEEPIPADDFEGYRRLSGKVGIPIGAGEAWFANELEAAVRNGLVDVVEPSVSRCGGVATEFAAAVAAEKRGVGFSPMVGISSSLSLAASLQVASAARCLGVEYDCFQNPLVEKLTPGFPTIRKGRIKVPSKNGLGVEIDEEFVLANLEGS